MVRTLHIPRIRLLQNQQLGCIGCQTNPSPFTLKKVLPDIMSDPTAVWVSMRLWLKGQMRPGPAAMLLDPISLLKNPGQGPTERGVRFLLSRCKDNISKKCVHSSYLDTKLWANHYSRSWARSGHTSRAKRAATFRFLYGGTSWPALWSRTDAKLRELLG
jgi:hypothetical protein